MNSKTDIIVPDEAYGPGWNGSLEVPTKNAVYDKVETISAGSGPAVATSQLAQATDFTLAANAGAIVPRRYSIASGTKLSIASGAIFKII